MTFQESIKVCLTAKYAVFAGRASRSEYWFFYLFAILAQVICNLIQPVLGTIFIVATIVPNLAVASRRLHDRDMSAWWMLAPFICYFITAFLACLALFLEEAVSFTACIIAFFATIIWSICLFAKKGTPGPNRFGDVPADLQSMPQAQSPYIGNSFTSPGTGSDSANNKNSSTNNFEKTFCPYCGAKITSGSRFCPFCGKPIE